MKKTFLLLCTAATIVSCNARPAPRELPELVTLTKERLLDKIKGGWGRPDYRMHLRRPDGIQIQRHDDPGIHPDPVAGTLHQMVV